jgi:HPt (histidine-containing phosphotransfer) domain-containing protein
MGKSSAALDRAVAPPLAAAGPAIDVAHLARMTFGEKGLQGEVLRLFDRQAAMLLARMKAAPPADLATLAHTLSGSARGIGAKRVAAVAEAVELAASGRKDPAGALNELAAAITEARAAIAELLRAA